MIYIGYFLCLIGATLLTENIGFGGLFLLAFGIAFVLLPIAWRSENVKRKRY